MEEPDRPADPPRPHQQPPLPSREISEPESTSVDQGSGVDGRHRPRQRPAHAVIRAFHRCVTSPRAGACLLTRSEVPGLPSGSLLPAATDLPASASRRTER